MCVLGVELSGHVRYIGSRLPDRRIHLPRHALVPGGRQQGLPNELLVLCTVYSVQCTMNSVQCTLYIVQCTVFIFLFFFGALVVTFTSDNVIN